MMTTNQNNKIRAVMVLLFFKLQYKIDENMLEDKSWGQKENGSSCCC